MLNVFETFEITLSNYAVKLRMKMKLQSDEQDFT